MTRTRTDPELESTLVENCRQFLRDYCGSAYMEVIGQRRAKGSGTTLGAPDAVVYRKGQVLIVEFKSRTGRLSRAQELAIHCRWQERVPTYVVSSEQEFADLMCGRLERCSVDIGS
jgi:hypothetical protein